MILAQLINEIKELRSQPSHRSSMAIFRMLENNRTLFLQNMDADNFNHAYKSFENLSEANAREYNTQDYRSEYEKIHSLLMFYLDRII